VTAGTSARGHRTRGRECDQTEEQTPPQPRASRPERSALRNAVVFIVDRSKDMIISGGENIYPREIEEVIYAFEGVHGCAVIGIAEDVRGEDVLALVVPNPGITLDLRWTRRARRRAARSLQAPRRFEVRDELPKTPTGKISNGPFGDEFGSWTASTRAAVTPRYRHDTNNTPHFDPNIDHGNETGRSSSLLRCSGGATRAHGDEAGELTEWLPATVARNYASDERLSQ
jgi:AMP-binding enzyme C-terminal domain